MTYQTKEWKEGYTAYHTNGSDHNPYSYYENAEKHTDWADGFRAGAKEGDPKGFASFTEVKENKNPPHDESMDGDEYGSIFDRWGTITYT